MGLDGVELVIALEEAFGVQLEVEEAVKTVSPRSIGDLIFSKLKTSDERVCQSQRAFYILRKALINTFKLKREDVSLDTRFRSFIPAEREREVWPQLQVAVAARHWPDLSRPVWMTRLITASSLTVLVITIFVSHRFHWGLAIGSILGVILTAVFASLAARFTTPFRHYVPARFQTVRDLIPPAMTSDCITWTREQVSDVVKQVVMEQLAVKETDYTEDSLFIDDFGMD